MRRGRHGLPVLQASGVQRKKVTGERAAQMGRSLRQLSSRLMI